MPKAVDTHHVGPVRQEHADDFVAARPAVLTGVTQVEIFEHGR
jgi:hypothetical protein